MIPAPTVTMLLIAVCAVSTGATGQFNAQIPDQTAALMSSGLGS